MEGNNTFYKVTIHSGCIEVLLVAEDSINEVFVAKICMHPCDKQEIKIPKDD